MNVWTEIPDESGAHPDYIYELPEPPWNAALHEGRLALAGGTGVYIWFSLPRHGELPDLVILGADSLADTSPGIGPDTLFYPGALAFDGTYLWVGEFKFSERLLRFSGSG